MKILQQDLTDEVWTQVWLLQTLIKLFQTSHQQFMLEDELENAYKLSILDNDTIEKKMLQARHYPLELWSISIYGDEVTIVQVGESFGDMIEIRSQLEKVTLDQIVSDWDSDSYQFLILINYKEREIHSLLSSNDQDYTIASDDWNNLADGLTITLTIPKINKKEF